MNDERYRSTAGPALASMDNWNAQQNRRAAMNAEQRAALARSIHNALNEYTRIVSVTTEDGKRRVENYTPEGEMEAIEKAIASFIPPQPDADAVEAVVRAIEGLDWNTGELAFHPTSHDVARAAIAAMPAPDDNWLDKTLDSVHPEATVEVFNTDNGFDVTVYFGELVSYGAGPTRMEAIKAAVAAAKEVQNDLFGRE